MAGMVLTDHNAEAQADDPRYFKYMSRATARIVLQQRTLRWSTPGTLNDPFDNQFDLHLDLDLERAKTLAVNKLWGIYLGAWHPAAGSPVADSVRRLREARPHLRRDEFELAVGAEITRSFPRLDHYVRDLQRELRPHMARHKLLCLALSETDIPMWSYYAENHRGVVLSFRNVADSPWSAGKAVRYHREMPRLLDEEGYSGFVSGRTRINHLEMLEKMVFTKSVAWAHEREWRVFSGAGREPDAAFEDIHFGVLELDALIVGCSMPVDEKREFRDLLGRLYPHAEAREVVRHERNFELVIQPQGHE